MDTCFCVQSCKFTCLVYFVTCMQPLQLVALLCTLLYSACIARGFPGSSAGKEATCNAGDPSSIPGLGTSTGEGIGYPFQFSWASLVAQLVKNPPAVWEKLGSISVLGRAPVEGKSYPCQYSGLENSIDCIYSSWGHKELDTT